MGDVPPDREGLEARQESGPPQKPGAGQDMGYNDSGHKELLMASGAGERPAKVPSPALCLRFPIAPGWGEPSPVWPTSAQQKKRTWTSPMCRRLPVCASVSAATVQRGQGRRECVRAML
jgi:hypothetical protein